MMNLKKIFGLNSCNLPVTKAEKEALECFLVHKKEFDHWFSLRQQQRVRFVFYYPTAIDFYFDDFKLFTAFYKKTSVDTIEFQELKMSKVNHTSIRTTSWKPFEEVILNFLTTLEEKNKISYFSKTKSLHEYAAMCEETSSANKHQNQLTHKINPSIATS